MKRNVPDLTYPVDLHTLFTNSYFEDGRLKRGMWNLALSDPDSADEFICEAGMPDEDKTWKKYYEKADVFVIYDEADETRNLSLIEERSRKYPKYKRSQNLTCKLSEKDIRYIRDRWVYRKYTHKMIARDLGVHYSTVQTWASEQNHRKKLEAAKKYNERAYSQRKPGDNTKYCYKYLERKKLLQPEIKKYIYRSQWIVMKTGKRQPRTFTEKYKELRKEMNRRQREKRKIKKYIETADKQEVRDGIG
jgi:DNA-binding transcriptional regulator YiaG